MAFSYSVLILQRGVLPLILVSAAMFRPVGISFVYLLMFFISPFIPVATAQNFRGSVTAYWIILIALSTILLLCHVALQITLLIFDMKDFADTCSFAVILVQHIGFIDLTIETLSIIQWVAPEVVVFLSAVVIYIIIKKLTSASGAAGQAENGEVGAPEDANVDNPVTSRARKIPRSIINKINFEPLVEVAPMFSLGTLFLASVLRPSVPGGFYFLIFLLSGTYWATFQTLQRGFAIMIRFVMVVLVVHTLTIISYQTSWMQEHINNETLVARLIGLEPLIHTACEGGDVELLFNLSSFKFDSFLNPFAMLFSYYVLALTSKNLIEKRIVSKPLSAFGQLENGTKNNRQFSLSTRTTNSNKKDSWSRSQRLNISIQPNKRSTEPTETTPLVRHKKIVRSIETSVEARKAENDIPMDVLDDGFEGEKDPSVFEQIAYGIVSVGGFIYQNSYIFTNILMMAWSIVYHSWLTFVFLLWANVLWMIPNQRKAMMRSSPLIVFYAELLLIAQYIYGMNLTNDELPSSVNITGINLQQIGLERPSEHNVQPCIPLIVKASFLLMFWVTLRQFFKEKNEKKKHTTLSDMVAPLQVSVGAATAGGDGSSPEHKKTSKFLKKAGDIIKNLLVRLWIWLLILVIFLCAITGDKMTGFRICYMAMFLFFLLVFQSSSQLWVKIMYGFWLFLIFYAMSILTLVYTYQFDKFDIYWHQYLNISKTIQEDIGLKKYETKDLFLHLLSPTIIVILTVIQVHYFHRRFIASLQNQPIGHHESHFAHKKRRKTMDQDGHSVDRASMAKDRASLAKDRASMAKDRASLATELEASGMTTQINDLMKRFLSEFKNRFKRLATTFKGTCWRFLEMQLINGVYIAAFISCVSEVCVLHIIFCGLCIIGLISKKKMQVFLSRIISLAVSIIILTKMVYQVQYISHERYDINCVNNDSVKNTAVWFGLQKASDYGGLLHLIKKYIIFIVMVTLHGVVTLRQKQMHTLRGEPHKQPPKLLFPGITRADAEKNLSGMIKYLFNYGFYKFGLEITFIALVCLITFRQDVVAIIYVIWLCVLLWMERYWMARIWGVFQCFTASLIFLEYVLLVGLPPGLCSEYPWTKSEHSHALQKWSMLPGNLEYSHVNKLIFDFIVLLFINRQKRAFSKEKKHESDPNYPGGSNKSVINDIENLGRVEFENPTRDFLATVRNYLDVIKNIIFCGFYWITLAVVFLAGTNISDSLALGYLIGSFIFLWQGSDFYLRPIRVILNRWNALLMYNVVNITTKTVFQIAGCLFLNYFQTHACWLIHLLGIECAEGSDLMLTADADESTSECPKLQSKSFLFWDTACFAFILIQMRIFRSHYFCHIINETKANALLADRGAGIIEDLRQKQIEHRKKHEQEILRKIKRKMEKIRATQQKTLRHIERPTHFDEEVLGFPSTGPKVQKRREIKFHPDAIRAGDYYMFEHMDEKFELDLIEDEVDFLDDPSKIDETERKMTRRKNLFEHDTHDTHDTHDKPKHTKPKDEVPSTSKDASMEEHESETESEDLEPPNPILRLLEAFMVSVVIRLNRFSRNYRYVMKILSAEKKALKESKPFEVGGSAQNVLETQKQLQTQTETKTQAPTPTPLKNLRKYVLLTEMSQYLKNRRSSTDSGASQKDKKSGALTYEEDFASRDHHIVVEVIISAWYAIVANTDVVCYIVVFVNQVVNASIISLPLPLMVFLWGSLSLPRPTKNFWVTLIAYTQALVFIKTFCDFKLLWTHYTNTQNPLDARSIIGLATGEHIATYDLLLLLVLFFHRFILKIQGLWKSQYLIVVEENAMVFKEDKTKRFPYEFSETPSRESPEAGTGTGTGTERNSVIAGPKISKMTEQYKSCGRQFFIDLMKKTRLPTDVYALMFLCDFVNFFVLLFGFTAFGNQQGDDGVQTYLLENKVPVPFLIMLLVQFILIVIDRALYLRKALFQKICFHFFSVIGIHVWMFFIIPAVTERNFNSLTPPVMFYIIKCFYLLFSSYQIKCGYPKRILGNFLTKGFSLVNMISFKVYMQVPFLFELRTVLDWVCTDTTMTLFDWLKMEDIFSEIYFIKCSRQMESDFPALRAQKKPMLTKIALGGTAILLIVIMIWGPLCLFALGNAVGQPNIAYEVQTSIRIGHFDPIYDTINRENIFPFDSAMFERLKDTYSKKRGATRFFSNYDETDIAAITMQPDAPSSWAITPPDKARLLRDLIKHKSLPCSFTYSLSRDPPIKGGVGTVSEEITINLSGNFSGREDMIAMLQGKGTSDSFVVIPNIIPKFIKVHNSGELTVVKQLMPENQEYRSLVIRLQSDNSSFAVWWEVQEDCDDSFYTKVLSKLPYASCDEVVMYTFNDKKFPSTFSFATAGGIIGLYTTFVLLASRFLKSSLSGQSRRVMYEDLPYVDRVLQLCLDIYLVREALELALEEDLFAKLLFLYRSPETMIKWTRHKEESIEDETDTESGRSSQRRQ